MDIRVVTPHSTNLDRQVVDAYIEELDLENCDSVVEAVLNFLGYGLRHVTDVEKEGVETIIEGNQVDPLIMIESEEETVVVFELGYYMLVHNGPEVSQAIVVKANFH